MKRRTGRLFVAGLLFLLVVLMCMGVMGAAEDGETIPVLEPVTDPVPGAIYMDLAAGNVEIGKKQQDGTYAYSGFVYANGVKQPVSGEHKTENKYYIYQSNLTDKTSPGYFKNTGYTDETTYNPAGTGNCRVPVYPRVQKGDQSWTEFITNNYDVYGVSDAWAGVAGNAGRKETRNRITFAQESNYTADVIIDNIWSTYHQESTSRNTGGIGAHLHEQQNTHIKLSLKGDNRVGCVHYSADYFDDDNKAKRNTIEFFNGETGETGVTQGSITVADFPGGGWNENHWNAAIGAGDNPGGFSKEEGQDRSDGIVIHSGVIYAGTTKEDNCTAIGGGGNNYGRVTIEDGTVTAVTAGTGTAIGGGIGYSDPGGDADVTITGGKIYAYNLGVIYKRTGNSNDRFEKFVPAAAIGGGGSNGSPSGSNTNVTITGGFVYAQSLGGPGIGGGSSAKFSGGPANITITGGTVIAKSVSGQWDGQLGPDFHVDAGASIGGGTGGTSKAYKLNSNKKPYEVSNENESGAIKVTGGTVNLNISGGIVRAGSIGGGQVNNGTGRIGSAKVKITGGDISGQVVMSGGDGTECTFDMSGGTLHSTDVVHGTTVAEINKGSDKTPEDPRPKVQIEYIQKDGGAVWIEDPNGKATITGDAVIEKCTAKLGGAVYMVGGTFTMTGGEIKGNTADINADISDEDGGAHAKEKGLGGGVCVYGGNVRMNGGAISGNHANKGGGMYVNQGNVTVVKGDITDNEATENGGGICIVATDSKEPLNVTMLSGSLSRNKAGNNGGGMAVEGNGQQEVTVDMGCMLDHNLLEIGKDPETKLEKYEPQLPIDYIDGNGSFYAKYQRYCVADGQANNRHESCPAVKDNSSGKVGGAIHIDCSSATLQFYCMDESGNKTGNESEDIPPDDRAPAIQVDGGTVNVGDEVYHNDQYNEEHGKDDHTDYTLTSARGYISIESNVLVQAGKVNVYGSLTNPKMDHIVAKIEVSDNDLFIDHRFSKDKDVYWLRYNENFKNGTGYVSYDYSVFDEIEAKDAPTTHDGYIFRGWCTASEYDENDDKLKLYQPGDKISKKSIVQTYKESEETVYCDKCKEYIEGHLKILYGIWDRLYTLKKDEDTTVRDNLNAAWDITYIESEWDPATNKFVVPELTEGEEPTALGADTAKMLPVSQVTFKPKPESSELPLTLTFEDNDTGNKVVESLERLAGNPDGYTIHESDSSSFTVTVTKGADGVYTLIMPKKHVTVSSVWELYLDYGTIELFNNGFQQQEYLPYRLDLNADPNAVNEWGGDYRIWQCEDNNQGETASHKSYNGTGHAFHSTPNVLQLHDDLLERADLTEAERKITLGNLNISSGNSIELKDDAQVKLTQTGKLQAKNILVPAGTELTWNGNLSPITLTPGAGGIAIGGKGGNITLDNVSLSITPSGSGTVDSTYVVEGNNVNLTNSRIGTEDAPVPGQLHATEHLKINKCTIYQQ